MNLTTIKEILNARKLTESDLQTEDVNSIYASDLMSDVLYYVKPKSLLITGLSNPQVIRTAEMIDLWAVCFVNAKVPSPELITLANDANIHVFVTDHSMYKSCGILYCNELKVTNHD